MRAYWIVSMLACFCKKNCRGPKALNTVCIVPKIRFPFLPKDKGESPVTCLLLYVIAVRFLS